MGTHAFKRTIQTVVAAGLLALALPASALASQASEATDASLSSAVSSSPSSLTQASSATSAASAATASEADAGSVSAASAGSKASSAAASSTSGASSGAALTTQAKKYTDGWHEISGKMTYWKDGAKVKSSWVSTDTPAYEGVTGTQRYWLDANGTLAVGRFIDKDQSADREAGCYAYANNTGAVKVGTFALNGKIYLANSKGALATARGWVSTSAYANGTKQRYYLVAASDAPKNVSVAKTGFFKVGKYRYYGIPNKGYLARGTYKLSGSYTLLASKSKGILRTSKGWLKSNSYGKDGKKHTYYLKEISGHKGYYAARSGFFKVKSGKKKYQYYAKPGVGHIIHGAYKYDDKLMLLANPKNGHLCGHGGWYKTSKIDSKGKTRTYRMRTVPGHSGYYAARTGLFTVSGYRYYGTKSKGYILKNGVIKVDGQRYRANSTGKLRSAGFMFGIDISSYQQSMNVTKVDADFVIIKATEGTGYVNPFWVTMTKQALASGKQIGFYHFANPGTTKKLSDAKAKERAYAEADFFIKTIGTQYLGKANLFLDFEAEALAQKNNYALYFMNRIKSKTGVTPMLYISKSYTRGSALNDYPWNDIAKKYPLWVAQYANYSIMGHTSDPWTDSYGTGPWASPTIYQYTSTGRISGYNENLDLDLFYGNATDWKNLAKVSK